MLNLPTTEERLGQSPQRLVRYFVLLMAVIYVGLGVWLWLSSGKLPTGAVVQLPSTVRRILGTLFIAYGLIRFWRGYQTHFRKKSYSDDNKTR